MKKFLLKLLFNKKQREIIWRAMIFSEYTYRRRGNIDFAAVVQTVINETQSTFGVIKDTYSKEEVDNIVAHVIKDTKAEFENTLKNRCRMVCKDELESAYKRGVDDTMINIAAVGIVVKDDAKQKQDSPKVEEQVQNITDENLQESTQQEQGNQTSEESEQKDC